MKISSAKGVRGYFIYIQPTQKWVFRVYDEVDKKFLDYDVSAEVIKVTIESNNLVLSERDGKNHLDFYSPVAQTDRAEFS